MVNINIHDVKKIEIRKIDKLISSYCRDIVIYTDNEKIEITIFSEDKEALEPVVV